MSRPLATIPAVAVLLLSGLVYLPSLPGGYVYDDHRFVEMNPAVTDGAGLGAYLLDPGTQAAAGSHEGLYRPLRTLTFRGGRLLGEGALPQRILNLLLHLANGILVWLLLRRLLDGGSALAPLLGALAFLLHPVATESVAWISSRGDVLALTCMLGSLLLYLSGGVVRSTLAVVCFLLALLSKESAIVLPALLVIVDAFRGGTSRVRAALRAYVPYVVVAVGFVALRTAVLGTLQFGQRGGLGLGPGETLLSLPAMLAYYLRVALVPAGLSFELRIASGARAPLVVALGTALLLGLLLLARACRVRARPVSLSIEWFLVALLPVTVLQVFFPLKILVANRFAYPALAAVAILATWIAARRRAVPLVLVALAAFVPLTWTRATAWRSDHDLWASVLATDPGNAAALFGAADDAMRRGEWGEARGLLLRAIDADPVHPQVQAYLGEACERLAAAHPAGSEARRRLVEEAYGAYREAARLWETGPREEMHLHRPTLINAARLAAEVGDAGSARAYALAFLAHPGSLPEAPAYRRNLVRRIGAVAEYLAETGEPDLAARLTSLARSLSPR